MRNAPRAIEAYRDRSKADAANARLERESDKTLMEVTAQAIAGSNQAMTRIAAAQDKSVEVQDAQLNVNRQVGSALKSIADRLDLLDTRVVRIDDNTTKTLPTVETILQEVAAIRTAVVALQAESAAIKEDVSTNCKNNAKILRYINIIGNHVVKQKEKAA